MKIPTFSRCAALLLAVLLLASCASSGDATAPAASMPSVAQSAAGTKANDAIAAEYGRMESAPMTSPAPAPTDGSSLLTDRKVVRNGSLELETKQFDSDLAAILALIEQAGGYIERQSVSGASLNWKGAYYERTASIGARIPADRFDEILSGVGGICNVVSRSENTSDITDSYYDTEARLNSLSLQEERLLEILSKAEKLEDVITLEQALSNVRYEIESLTASLRRMDAQVSYSSVSMSLREVVEYQTVTEKPKTLGERVAASWSRAIKRIGSSLENIVLFAVGDLPVMLLWLAVFGVIAGAAYLLAKKIRARLLRKRTPPEAAPKPPENTK